MSKNVYDQLLQIPPAQLVNLALAGLECQGELLAKVIESMQRQLRDVICTVGVKRIYLAGCGDSYFAALCARYAFEQLTHIPTVALKSMEAARYTLLPPNSLVIAISSGGDVSMTLEAGRVAKRAGVGVIGVTAQTESPLAQEFSCLITNPGIARSDYVDQVALLLGNFSFSLAALYLVAIHIGENHGYLRHETAEEVGTEIKTIPNAVKQAIGRSKEILEYLESVSDEADFYFLGAGPSYGIARYYQAKFFEQAQRPVYGVELEQFIHEQFLQLRPGKDAYVWFIVPPDRSRERALEVMAGCHELGARVIAVTNSNDGRISAKADLIFPVEAKLEMFSPLVSVVPGELLGIHAFARWGSKPFSASTRGRQIAASRQLTREGER